MTTPAPAVPPVTLSADGKWIVGIPYNPNAAPDDQDLTAIAASFIAGTEAYQEFSAGNYADGTQFYYTTLFVAPQLQPSILGKQVDAILALVEPAAPPS